MTDDELEAQNAKYNCARIVRLTSGSLALFSPWTNADGTDLLVIGSLTEIERMIPTVAEIDAEYQSRSLPDPSILTKLQALGLVKPQAPIRRL